LTSKTVSTEDSTGNAITAFPVIDTPSLHLSISPCPVRAQDCFSPRFMLKGGSMLSEWQIKSRAHACARTQAPFSDGEVIYTLLFLDPFGFRR
jgi:hypothetical protein